MSRRLCCLFFVLTVVCAGVPVVHAQIINEWVTDHTGSDVYEFIEIYGAGSTDYSSFSLLVVEGDSGTGVGHIDQVYPVGTTNADGFWYTGPRSSEIENGSCTLMLVNGFSGAPGNDIDANDDGVIDNPLWTSIVDDVAVSYGGAGDVFYSSVVLDSSIDSNTYPPGGASRIPNGVDSNAVGDWKRNDYSGCGLPGYGGYLDVYEACNSPQEINTTLVAGPVLNEFVAHHVGTDDHEFIEIAGELDTYYFFACILVITGDEGASTGNIDAAFQVQYSSSTGYWSTGYLNQILEDGTYSIVLAEWPNCEASVGTDLDTNDDGFLDSTPWVQVFDSVAVSDGGANDRVYSNVVLTAGFDGVAGVPGGASRVPDGIDTDSIADWMRNDFDGAGMSGFAGSLVAGEAYNTPNWLNRVSIDDYYDGVEATTANELRAKVHDAIDDHKRFDYTNNDGETDVWDVLERAQEDPADSGRILDTYKNASYPKYTAGNSDYDREHSWPKSYGFPDDGPDNSPYTDCHQLQLADGLYNGYRSNMPFRYCGSGCTERVTEYNNGTGGNGGTGYPGFSNWSTGSGTYGTWETWIGKRGDIARAQLYMDVRYEGDAHSRTGYPEPDLILTDSASLILSGNTTFNESVAYMGMLTDLLAWHLEDPVDDDERYRNEVVYSYQGNRNPFVDHPEWVECIFEGTNCNPDVVFEDDFETGGYGSWSFVQP